jgi:hypothetical protein
MPDSIDFTNVLQPDWKDLGIRIDVSWRLRMNGPGAWGATVSKRRETPSGREGKPVHLVTLIADSGQSPSDLLRDLAIALEQMSPIPVTG